MTTTRRMFFATLAAPLIAKALPAAKYTMGVDYGKGDSISAITLLARGEVGSFYDVRFVEESSYQSPSTSLRAAIEDMIAAADEYFGLLGEKIPAEATVEGYTAREWLEKPEHMETTLIC